MQASAHVKAETRELRGRGALSNASGRYERETRVLVDDGWTNEDETPPTLKTEVLRDSSRTIIARNRCTLTCSHRVITNSA
jgi:hypothetical protein